jgi:N-acetylneuraminic acid mutarotase
MLTRASLVLVISLVGCGDERPVATCAGGPGWWPAPPVQGGGVQETAAVTLDGKVYVIGGFTATIEAVSSVRIYDAATCTWSDGPPLPGAIHHANAVVADRTLYVVGTLEGNFLASGVVWAWNPSTDAGWTPRTGMPVGTERGAAVTGFIDGRIYVAGGLNESSQAMFSAYSIAEDRWDISLPPLPQNRDHACGGVVGGKLYVVGGRRDGVISPLVFEYTPGGGWVEKAAMPTARAGIGCGLDRDRIAVAGGEGNGSIASGVFSEVEVYTVSRDRWESRDPMVTPRHGMGAAIVDGVLYVPGGATVMGFAAVDTHEALEL